VRPSHSSFAVHAEKSTCANAHVAGCHLLAHASILARRRCAACRHRRRWCWGPAQGPGIARCGALSQTHHHRALHWACCIVARASIAAVEPLRTSRWSALRQWCGRRWWHRWWWGGWHDLAGRCLAILANVARRTHARICDAACRAEATVHARATHAPVEVCDRR